MRSAPSVICCRAYAERMFALDDVPTVVNLRKHTMSVPSLVDLDVASRRWTRAATIGRSSISPRRRSRTSAARRSLEFARIGNEALPRWCASTRTASRRALRQAIPLRPISQAGGQERAAVEHSEEHQLIRCNLSVRDTKSDTAGSSTGLLDVAPSRIDSTLVQVRPLGAAEEKLVEMTFGR